MLVGILSDSHGHQLAVRKAMALFDKLGVGHVIHCGDVGGAAVFDELVGQECTFVWGNMDHCTLALEAYLNSVGIPLPGKAPTIVELDGKRLAVCHGHERTFHHTLDALDVDYVLHGHTHEARDERLGCKRIINPGALYRTRRKTVATLDTETDELTFLEIE